MPTALYRLVSGRSLKEVREHVAQLEREGFRAFGRRYKTIASPDGKLDGNRFFQAMLKEDRGEDEPESRVLAGEAERASTSLRK